MKEIELEKEIVNYLKDNVSFSLDTISLLVYSIECEQKNDLYLLAKALQEENNLNSIVKYFSGTTLKLPTIEEFKLYEQISIYFFFTEIERKKFSFVTDLLKQNGNEVNHILIGKKLSEFKDKLTIKLNKIVKELI